MNTAPRDEREDASCPRDELLAALGAGALTPAEETAARAHLASCAVCRDALAGNEAAAQKLRSLPAPRPSKAARDRAYAAVLEAMARGQGEAARAAAPAAAPRPPATTKPAAPAAPARTPLFRVLAGLAAAACVALVAGISLMSGMERASAPAAAQRALDGSAGSQVAMAAPPRPEAEERIQSEPKAKKTVADGKGGVEGEIALGGAPAPGAKEPRDSKAAPAAAAPAAAPVAPPPAPGAAKDAEDMGKPQDRSSAIARVDQAEAELARRAGSASLDKLTAIDRFTYLERAKAIEQASMARTNAAPRPGPPAGGGRYGGDDTRSRAKSEEGTDEKKATEPAYKGADTDLGAGAGADKGASAAATATSGAAPEAPATYAADASLLVVETGDPGSALLGLTGNGQVFALPPSAAGGKSSSVAAVASALSLDDARTRALLDMALDRELRRMPGRMPDDLAWAKRVLRLARVAHALEPDASKGPAHAEEQALPAGRR